MNTNRPTKLRDNPRRPKFIQHCLCALVALIGAGLALSLMMQAPDPFGSIASTVAVFLLPGMFSFSAAYFAAEARKIYQGIPDHDEEQRRKIKEMDEETLRRNLHRMFAALCVLLVLMIVLAVFIENYT